MSRPRTPEEREAGAARARGQAGRPAGRGAAPAAEEAAAQTPSEATPAPAARETGGRSAGTGSATLTMYTAGNHLFAVPLSGVSHETAIRIRDFLLRRDENHAP